ncbi:peptidylprolyl isomerase [Henriciella sp. AS95]|uniref:peptidylprolyl isomerase n=1 Tax=Henriciella sp. AS95 TaxID=3135782 RepID=UPI003177D46B
MKTFRIASTAAAGLALVAAVACAQETPSADTETAPAEAAEPAAPQFTMADVEAAPETWREVEPDNLWILETNKGRIIVEMLPEVAPKHVEQFRAITKSGDYDGTVFHRVIDDFMAQGGDIFALKGRESGLPDIPGEFIFRRDPSEMTMNPIGPEQDAKQGLYKGFPMASQAQFVAEMTADNMLDSWIPHCPGVVSTARTDDPNSANSQFFLMRHQASHLDKNYTAWGRVVDGFDVVRAIKKGPKPNGTPIENPDVLNKAVMASDLPEAERPVVYVQRTDTQAWTDKLAAADQLDTDICDVPRVPAVVEG